jgi:hypothetical protein
LKNPPYVCSIKLNNGIAAEKKRNTMPLSKKDLAIIKAAIKANYEKSRKRKHKLMVDALLANRELVPVKQDGYLLEFAFSWKKHYLAFASQELRNDGGYE